MVKAKIKKVKKTKKPEKIEKKKKIEVVCAVEDIKKIGGEEEPEKEGGTLSDGVLDAFDELAPVDILIEEEAVLAEEEDDELDSGDYRANDEW